MKTLIGYPIWAAGPEMLEWLLDGFVENFKGKADAHFYFDEMRNDFDAHKILAAKFNKNDTGFTANATFGPTAIRDLACHNWLIDYFINETDTDILVIPQDDIRFQSPTLLDDLERVMSLYQDKIGYIGMREGYGIQYADMVASPFDAPYAGPGKVKELPIGAFTPCVMVNPGPLAYPRSTIEKIGKLDPSFRDWHWWADYSLKTHFAGLTNVLLSIDALHKKFGNCRASTVAADPDGWEPKDRALLNDRWKGHFNGRNIV